MTHPFSSERFSSVPFSRWLLFSTISIPLVAYATFLIFFYVQQRSMLFPGQDRPVQIVNPAQADGLIAAHFATPLGAGAGFAWYLEPPAVDEPAPVVIIGHGNGEIADDWIPIARVLQARGYAILILGYPGYGQAAGSPTKESIVSAAIGAYDWLIERPEIDKHKIIIFGHSLGGAAVLALAEQRPSQGAILLSAFASINHIAHDRYLPPFLAKDRFDNVAILKRYNRPVYLMHGTQDLVVLPYQAELLHQAAAQSQLKWLPCGHNGCIGDIDQFWDNLEPIMREMIKEQ